MRTLIVTVAGTATRFNRDTDRDTLKCLYYQESPCYSLLYQILDKARELDEYVIVGGYLFEELSDFVARELKEFAGKIKLVYNPSYKEYGSGYSLIKGIEAVSPDSDEIIFVEGDLYFDRDSFDKVMQACRDVITVNREFITSQKAVALYVDMQGHVHYLYDTRHEALLIPEAFRAVYNSAQVWKFLSPKRLQSVVQGLTPSQIQGTNLEIIQGYFGECTLDTLEFIPLEVWYNCNNVSDYNKVYSLLTL